MKRGIALLAAASAVGVLAPVASARPAADVAARTSKPAIAHQTTTWTAEYDASEYYGAVKCTGRTVVSNTYPGGKDVELCETTEGTLQHMKAGREQHSFETSGGGSVGEWESDSGDGKRSTDFSYTVNRKLTKFRLIAIYPAPEA